MSKQQLKIYMRCRCISKYFFFKVVSTFTFTEVQLSRFYSTFTLLIIRTSARKRYLHFILLQHWVKAILKSNGSIIFPFKFTFNGLEMYITYELNYPTCFPKSLSFATARSLSFPDNNLQWQNQKFVNSKECT